MQTDFDVIAIIPARGGSKRLPKKNLMTIGGQPLIAHTLRHAKESQRVGTTYVSTDDPEIACLSRSMGAQVVDRPAELSGDSASSESALLHVLDRRIEEGKSDPDLVAFLQCTSPVRRGDDLDKAIDQLIDGGSDSLFSACDNKRLIWDRSEQGNLRSLTYNYDNRQREQESQKQFYENGSLYVFRPSVLRNENNRLGGIVDVYEMDIWSSFQLDNLDDASLINWILERPEFNSPSTWPNRIDFVVFDFDGVMTDNTVAVAQDGRESVVCNRSDGLGIDALRAANIPVMVLSTEKNPVVQARADKLQIPCLHGLDNKAAALEECLLERRIASDHVVYLGNDRNDLGCMELAGFPVAVADAHPSAKAAAKLVLSKRGGHGAVRELCDLILDRNPPTADA